MTRMIANARQLLDQGGDSRQSPQVGFVTVTRRPSQKFLGDRFRLLGGEFGFAAGRALAGQGSVSHAFRGGLPAIGHLPRHFQAARHFGRRTLFLKQLAGLFAPLFHLGMIPRLRHAQTIKTALTNVTLLCESQ